MLFLQIMRNLLRHTFWFFLYLAGLSILLHSLLPHEHHYGHEPEHILNELKKDGLHDVRNTDFSVFLSDTHASYICHFNPKILSVQDNTTDLLFIGTYGIRVVANYEAELIKPYYDVRGYAPVTMKNCASRAPPINFL